MLVDAVQIEPGSGDTLLIERDATTGAMTFRDAVITTPITLQQIAGLPSIENIITVGKSGAGAQYTTVTAALATIPATAGPTNPYLVLVGPGVYKETFNIVRDHVTIVGLGGVTFQSLAEDTPNGVGADNTVIIHADLGTIPRHVVLRNLTITNSHDLKSCVRVVGAAASTVGADIIRLENCFLQATGAGYPIRANSVNHVHMYGGSMRGSASTSLVLAEECASVRLQDVAETTALQLDYDTTGDTPSAVGCDYRIHGSAQVAIGTALSPPVSSTLSGDGQLTLSSCGEVGDVTVDGDRSVLVVGSTIGDLTLSSTTAGTLVASKRGTATGATATLEEPVLRGGASFAASASEAVVFGVPMPDDDYTVGLELLASPGSENTYITSKSATGFTINFTSAVTLDVEWTAIRSFS